MTDITLGTGASAASFKEGMKRLLCGVSVITTSLQGENHGFLSTNLCTPRANPPELLICVNSASSCHDPIVKSGAFNVNVLSAQQRVLFDVFSKPALRATRFAESDWYRGSNQIPVFSAALTTFLCEVVETVLREEHSIFIGRVREIVTSNQADSAPLSYFDGACGAWVPPKRTLGLVDTTDCPKPKGD